jgi:hypothetical protein
MTDDAAPASSIVLYQTEDGRTRVECRFDDETIWLSQALIAELFQKDVRTINEHLKNIVEEGEIDPAATIRKFRIVQGELPFGLPAAHPTQLVTDCYQLREPGAESDPVLGADLQESVMIERFPLVAGGP